jgi:hypothetical protein
MTAGGAARRRSRWEHQRWVAALSILLAGACTSEWERDDLEGRPCPCLPEWVCDTSRGEAGVCVAKGAALGGSGGAGAGGGGAGAGGGSRECPPLAEPGGGSCPEVCDECSDDTCVIRCDDARACNAMTLSCPAGFRCDITCSSDDNCASLDVACAEGYACSTRCEGRRTCVALSVVCASGPCALSCADGAQICRDSELHCGTGRCQATCQGNTTPLVAGCESSCSPSCGC